MPNATDNLTLEQVCRKFMAESIAEKPQQLNIMEVIAGRNSSYNNQTCYMDSKTSTPMTPSPLTTIKDTTFSSSLSKAFSQKDH